MNIVSDVGVCTPLAIIYDRVTEVLIRGPANVEETDRTYIYKIISVIYCKAQATTSILYRL